MESLQDLMRQARHLMAEASTLPTVPVPFGASQFDTQMAAEVVADMPTAPVLQDMATIIARHVGTELLARGLRPADYVAIPELAQTVAKAVAAELAKAPDEFQAKFAAELRIQG